MENFENNVIKLTPSIIVERLYKLAYEIDRLFLQIGVDYWVTGGTALGCIRNQGLIPWDDDIDICVAIDDIDILKNNIQKLNQKGLQLQESSFGYRIFHISDSEPINNDFRYPFCDVWVMKIFKKKYVLNDKSSQGSYPLEKWSIYDVKNKQRKKFANFQVNCSLNTDKYLNSNYPQWSKIGLTNETDHYTSKRVPTHEFEMQTFEPAKPFIEINEQ